MVETQEVSKEGTILEVILFSKERTNGTIDDYLRYGLKLGIITVEDAYTYVETTAIWQDEYELNPIADMFLAERKDGYDWPDAFYHRELARARKEGL